MNDKTDKGAMQIDVNLVRELADMLDSTNLTEIEVEDGDRKIRVARKVHAAAAAPAFVAAPAPQSHGTWLPGSIAMNHGRCVREIVASMRWR